MTFLIDRGQTWELLSDTTVRNFGRAGGVLRVILVQRFDTEYPERMSVEHFLRCDSRGRVSPRENPDGQD